MTKSQQFVIERIKELYQLFPNIQIRYEYEVNYYEEKDVSHIVEILPVEIFESEQFKNWKSEVLFKFATTFHYSESLLFISENSLSMIENNCLNDLLQDYEKQYIQIEIKF